MKVVLLRHGQSLSATLAEDDVCPPDAANPLTTEGRRQMRAFAEIAAGRLSKPRLFASDMRRARESAAVLSGPLGVEVVHWPELREIVSVDRPMRVRDLQALYREFWMQVFVGHPSDQTRGSQARAAALKQKIIDAFDMRSDVILVSHGGIIELLLVTMLRISSGIGYTVEFDLPTGEAHVLDVAVGDGRLLHLRLLHAGHR